MLLLNLMISSLPIFCECFWYNKHMEDQKKKFLLSRIKKQETLIISEYEKLKHQFISQIVTKESNQHYIEQVVHLITLNNSLAANLFQYLDKDQVAAVFERVNTVFNDLVDKFKKIQTECRMLQNGKGGSDIRQICDVCHQKMEFNRIENLKKILHDESQSCTAVIKKVIEQEQKESMEPVFTEQEDLIFKTQLQKVFKGKQLTLETNINQSSAFLETVETEITDFMVSFRNELADWEVTKDRNSQNKKWGNMMKDYINKKLTNSFQNKIPSWVKKMHDMFVNHQPVKQNVYTMSKEIQTTDSLSVKQNQLHKELEDVTNKLIIKRQALKITDEQLQAEKMKNKELRSQLDGLQKYYQEKINQIKEEKNNRIQMTQASHRKANKESVGNSQVSLLESKEDEKQEHKSRKKIGKFPFSPQCKHGNPFKLSTLQKQQQGEPEKSRISVEDQDNCKLNRPLHSNSIHIRKDVSSPANNSIIMDGYKGESEPIKLKKRVYNRQNKQEFTNYNDHQEGSVNQIGEHPNNISVCELKDKVKDESAELANSLQANKMALIPTLCKKQTSFISLVKSESNQQNIKRTVHKMPIKSMIDNKIIAEVNLTETSAMDSVLSSNHLQISKNYKQILQLLNTLKKENTISNEQKQLLVKIIKHYFDSHFQEENQPIKQKDNQTENQQNKQNLIKCSTLSQNNKNTIPTDLPPNTKNHLPRKNKSLHTVRHQPSEARLKLPNISVHQQEVKVNEPAERLGKDTIILFIDQKVAFKYEQSFIQSHHQNQSVKPNELQLQKLSSLFAILQNIKSNNYAIYKQICSFIRYPFTSIKDSMVVIDIISELTFPSFCNYFFKIMWFHKQCEIKEQHQFCLHIQSFINKMHNLISKDAERSENYKKERKSRPSLRKNLSGKTDQ